MQYIKGWTLMYLIMAVYIYKNSCSLSYSEVQKKWYVCRYTQKIKNNENKDTELKHEIADKV